MWKRIERLAAPLGMVGAAFYFAHTIGGRLMWTGYNPITTDISSLTADGAPNASLLRVFTAVYAACMIAFSGAMTVRAFRSFGRVLRAGYALLLTMELISAVGYALFPLSGDKTTMTFQNAMHIAVTAAVVLTTLASAYLLAIGYLRRPGTARLGCFALAMAIGVTAGGLLNPIGMAAGLNILGLTERITIYSLQLMIVALSAHHTFADRDG